VVARLGAPRLLELDGLLALHRNTLNTAWDSQQVSPKVITCLDAS
jgi:hypothetical protein